MVDQAPGFYRTQVGATLVTALSDGYLDGGTPVLRGIAEAEAAALLHAAFRTSAPLRISVNAFALQRDGRTALVDAGGGTGMAPTLGRLPAALAAAGIAREAIDTVLLTHLHSDHVGGLLDAAGQRTLPQARLCVARTEAAFFRDDVRMAAAGPARSAGFLAARKVLDAYADGLTLLDPGEEAFPGTTLVPLPGHTPGHAGYRIGAGAESLLIWGDIAHVPELQIPRPEVTVLYDTDPTQAEATRRQLLAQVAAERLRVAGMHLHFPCFAHVVGRNGTYALVPEPWMGVV